MDIDSIAQELRACSLSELRQLDDLIATLMEERYRNPQGAPAGTRQKRQEDRFSMNLVGTLTRVTDIKPGQRIEFSASIQDVSRSGMRLHVSDSFIPSRIVRIVFASLNGKIKDRFLEVVRIHRISNQNGSWLELGCRAIDANKAMRIRRQQNQLRKMQNELADRPGIMVQVVGLEHDPVCRQICRLLKSRDYHVQHFDTIRRAFQSAQKTKAQLIVICHGTALSQNGILLKTFRDKPRHMAALAIIRNRQERQRLLEAGLDECLLETDIEESFIYSLERALMGHLDQARRSAGQSEALEVLVISRDRAEAGVLEYGLKKAGCRPHVVGVLGEAHRLSFPVDLVLADYDPAEEQVFAALKKRFDDLPLIALCRGNDQGRQAMVAGADNFLALPVTQRELGVVLKTAMNIHRVR